MNSAGGPALGLSAVMLAAGIGIPTMATLSSALGARIGVPTSVLVLLSIAMLITAIVASATGGTNFTRVSSAPVYLFAGGLFMAFYLLSITYVAPVLGVGIAIFLVLFGQLAAAALIDHYGLFGAPQTRISYMRVLGIALMAAGVFLARKPPG